MLKKTRTREEVLSLLKSTTSPLSANEIFEALGQKGITLSSIYRTLDTFTKNDIAQKETNPQGVAMYTLKKDKHTHILECKACHKKMELDYCPYHKANESIRSKHDFVADEENIIIYGTCKECITHKKG